MDPIVARKCWRTLEPYHGLVYFAPEPTAAYDRAGLDRPAHYFASRAAAMGAVGAEVVIATFYNFCPGLVRSGVPAVWDTAGPADLLDARLSAADAALREALGDEAVTSAEMVWAAGAARRAAEGCTPQGRPLYAAHAALPWPDEPHLALWHALTLLREHRGDGHVAALLTEGLDGCESLVTHAAAGDALVTADVLRSSRGWPDGEWAAAEDRLRDRGLIDADGGLTAAGTELRDRIERTTDERALAPWEHLGEEEADRLRATVRPWSKAIAASGAFGLG